MVDDGEVRSSWAYSCYSGFLLIGEVDDGRLMARSDAHTDCFQAAGQTGVSFVFPYQHL